MANDPMYIAPELVYSFFQEALQQPNPNLAIAQRLGNQMNLPVLEEYYQVRAQVMRLNIQLPEGMRWLTQANTEKIPVFADRCQTSVIAHGIPADQYEITVTAMVIRGINAVLRPYFALMPPLASPSELIVEFLSAFITTN